MSDPRNAPGGRGALATVVAQSLSANLPPSLRGAEWVPAVAAALVDVVLSEPGSLLRALADADTLTAPRTEPRDASTTSFGDVHGRFVGDAVARYTERAFSPLDSIYIAPEVRMDSIVFTVRRSDGATFEMTAQRRDAKGHLMAWTAGTDPEFLIDELFRRANEHYAHERRAALIAAGVAQQDADLARRAHAESDQQR